MRFQAFCVVVAGVIGIPMSASADLLIQSFEGPNLTVPTNVVVNTPDVTSHGFDTIGATDGSASYRVTPVEATSGAGAKFLLKIDLLSNPAVLDALQINPVIAFDLTIPDDDDPGDGVAGVGTVSVANSDGGGFNADYYVEYVAFGAASKSYYFTFAEAIIDGLDNPANTYSEITIGLNSQPGVQPVAYFDNLRVVALPEPASIALLGLGSVVLFRRR